MEIILVLGIALLVLGPKKLPEAGRSIGRGMREFKESLTGGGDDDHELLPVESAERTPAPRAS